MKIFKSIFVLIVLLILLSCKEKTIKFSITNELDIERSFETIELTKGLLSVTDLTHVGIKDVETGELLITQNVDNDGNGVMDEVLFQPVIPANSERMYEVVTITEAERPKAPNNCYSRFVPERTDDYAWENDKVAFRVYGPTAQKMKEKGDPMGTLSSGIDAWLKRVEYPIINNWYRKYMEGGSYHEDVGEGLDNFHVGASRGVGGLAIKKDTTYYFSKNYTDWRTITTGPIRTSFYLSYADWDANGSIIKESKTISLDLGNNLSRFDVSIEGADTVSVGLTLHEKDGVVSGDIKNGWVSYWQPHGSSELGTAIVVASQYFVDFETYDINETDLSNVYETLKVWENKVTYYAGFNWKESGQFKDKQEWEAYLKVFSRKIQNPLMVELIE